MDFIGIQIQSNALLKSTDLMSKWSSYCNPRLISKVLFDLKQCDYPIEEVEGSRSYWDVTTYLKNSHTECSFDEKIKAIYGFSLLNTSLLINGEKYIGSANVIAALIRNYTVSDQLQNYLIDCGYRLSHNESFFIEQTVVSFV